ncbi:MAG: AtpZ/AtpI family protein [Lachnospiraceae bacterium]
MIKTLALVTQLGISMITPVMLCVLIGVKIDERYHTHWFLPLLLLGIAAGVRNVYVLVKDINQDKKEGTLHEEEKSC